MRHDALRNRERRSPQPRTSFDELRHRASARRSPAGRVRRAGTVFRHFPTKSELIEAVLVRHFARLTERARQLAGSAQPGQALRSVIREMIETGPAKITLASLAAGPAGVIPPGAQAASRELRGAVETVLRRAQDAGQARPDATIDEVYLLVRSLAQASAATSVPPPTLRRAADIILAGLAAPVGR